MVSQLHVYNSCSRHAVLVRVVPADFKCLEKQTTEYNTKGKVGVGSSAKVNADAGYSQNSTYKGMDITPGFVKIAPKDFLRWDSSDLWLDNYKVPEDRSVIVKEDSIILSKYGDIYTGVNGRNYK